MLIAITIILLDNDVKHGISYTFLCITIFLLFFNVILEIYYYKGFENVFIANPEESILIINPEYEHINIV